MFGRGVDGVSGRELMTLAGAADKVSEGARVSIGSSDSIFIGLIFFLRLSSFSFLLGRDSSNSAGRKDKGKTCLEKVQMSVNFANTWKNKKSPLTHCPLPTDVCP